MLLTELQVTEQWVLDARPRGWDVVWDALRCHWPLPYMRTSDRQDKINGKAKCRMHLHMPSYKQWPQITGQARGTKDLEQSNDNKTRKETAGNITEVAFNRCSPSQPVEGKGKCIIKDDSKVSSLKEERKMVKHKKVRKRDRFGDEKTCLAVNILYLTPFCQAHAWMLKSLKFSFLGWGGPYFIIPADGQSFSKSVPLKISSKSPVLWNTTEFLGFCSFSTLILSINNFWS